MAAAGVRVLAFSVARAPGRALIPKTPGLLSDRAWTALAMGLTIGVFVLVGALAGRLTRSATERVEPTMDGKGVPPVLMVQSERRWCWCCSSAAPTKSHGRWTGSPRRS
ncbi:hypothetical protein DMH04_10790 [Kibdelosporangium aridum]|uniref:Uncharacterized protein n=1 Tax=Kibdelosporangium aridum TaxID=2030 RepID=A0A428ZHR5_KIBAR|nr:hypothetical protein DMH04_10790 [Kibdelosporangium aridum]